MNIKRPAGARTPTGLLIMYRTMTKYNQISHILQSISLRISDYQLNIVLRIKTNIGGYSHERHCTKP